MHQCLQNLFLPVGEDDQSQAFFPMSNDEELPTHFNKENEVIAYKKSEQDYELESIKDVVKSVDK